MFMMDGQTQTDAIFVKTYIEENMTVNIDCELYLITTVITVHEA